MTKRIILAMLMTFAVILAAAQSPTRTTINGNTNRQSNTATSTTKQNSPAVGSSNRANQPAPRTANDNNKKSDQHNQPGNTQSRPSYGGGGQQGGNGHYNNQNLPPRDNRSGDERIRDARDHRDNARIDYRNTRTQVRIDGRQQPSSRPPLYAPPGHPQIRRQPVPPPRVYTRAERLARTNMSRIVVQTSFFSREEAMRYIEELLYDRFYDIESFTSSSMTTSWTEIPTGFVSTALFSMRFNFTRTSLGIKVTISGRWRASSLASAMYHVIFQPDSAYATYYAWEIMEDLALELPRTRSIYYLN